MVNYACVCVYTVVVWWHNVHRQTKTLFILISISYNTSFIPPKTTSTSFVCTHCFTLTFYLPNPSLMAKEWFNSSWMWTLSGDSLHISHALPHRHKYRAGGSFCFYNFSPHRWWPMRGNCILMSLQMSEQSRLEAPRRSGLERWRAHTQTVHTSLPAFVSGHVLMFPGRYISKRVFFFKQRFYGCLCESLFPK